mgnify:CR=1 FL=1
MCPMLPPCLDGDVVASDQLGAHQLLFHRLLGLGVRRLERHERRGALQRGFEFVTHLGQARECALEEAARLALAEETLRAAERENALRGGGTTISPVLTPNTKFTVRI